MQTIERNSNALKAAQDRFFWDLSYKYRKVLIPVVIILIIIGAAVLLQNYIAMQVKVKQLSAFEPVYVLSAKRDLSVGDTISSQDLEATLYYKKEYKKFNYKVDKASGDKKKTAMPETSMIQCRFDNGKLSGFTGIVGRVVKVPILAGTPLRKEFFAAPGAVPGLTNLIEPGQSLLNVGVAQVGFNVFIKPDDFVELYINDKKLGTRLLASKVKVILVDSLPLGKAPFQVPVNPSARRSLTLAVPDGVFERVLAARSKGTLVVTYKNKGTPVIVDEETGEASPVEAIKKFFQPLTLIKGSKKEVHISN